VKTEKQPKTPKSPKLNPVEAKRLAVAVHEMRHRVAEMRTGLNGLYGPLVMNKSERGDNRIVVTVDSPVEKNENAVREWLKQADTMLDRIAVVQGTVEGLELAEATQKYILKPTADKISQDTETRIVYARDLGINEVGNAVANARQQNKASSNPARRAAYRTYLDNAQKTAQSYRTDTATDPLYQVKQLRSMRNNVRKAGSNILLDNETTASN